MSQTQRQPPTVTGPIQSVPCPHCGKTNDLRDLDQQNILDTGAQIVCSDDNGAPASGHCGRVFEVTGIRQVKFVSVRPSHASARAAQPAAQPARAVAPGFMRKLLGGK